MDWMIEQSGAELFMFSTDFPHPEGGRDRLQKFDGPLASSSEEDRSKFLYDNFHELLHGHPPPEGRHNPLVIGATPRLPT
jgi:hypothetical protein